MQAHEAISAERARWDAFVAASPHRSFMQTWAWGELQGALPASHWRILIEDNGKILALALVLQRRVKFGYSWLYVPRGPIFAEYVSQEERARVWELVEEKLTSLAQECGSFFVRIDPLWEEKSKDGTHGMPDVWHKAPREVQPRNTALVDLTLSEEELLKRMHPKTRYNIRLAERKGVSVEYSEQEDAVDRFLDASRAVSRRSGFAYHPDAYYRKFLGTLGNLSMAELAIARVNDEILAVHIMVYADGIATYVHGASSEEKRSYMAPALLYWETMRRAKEKNMEQYDFFGVAPADADDNHPWAGITRMKMGFGGKRVAYIGAYDLVLNEGLYAGFGIMRNAATKVRGAMKNSVSRTWFSN